MTAAQAMSPPAPDSLARKVRLGLVWSLVRHWGSRLISFALFVVVARLLQPADVGLFAASMAVLAIVEIFVDPGLGRAIVQRRELTAGQINLAFWVNAAGALVLSLLLWFMAPLAAQLLNLPALTNVLRAGTLWLLFSALGLAQLALYERRLDYRALAVRTLTATAVSGGVGVTLASLGFGAWALVAQSIVMTGLMAALLWYRSPWRPTREFAPAGFREMLHYGVRILGSRILDFANNRSIELILAATLGAATLGLYQIGARLYHTLMQLLSSAILDVAHSGFSRLADERARLQAAYYRSVGATAAIAMPCFVALALLAPELCTLLFGQRWAGAAQVLMPLALLGATQVVQFYNGGTLNAIGLSSITLRINLAKVAATATSLTLTWGQPLGVVVGGFVAGQLCVSPYSYAMARRHVGVSLRHTLRTMQPFLIGLVAMFAVTLALRQIPAMDSLPVWLDLLLLAAAAALAYAATSMMLGRAQLLALWRELRSRPAAPPPPADE